MAEARVNGTLGPYRLLRELGRGAMGVVYEAEHAELGLRRALKVFLRPDDAALLKRFFAEGRLLARLEHPRLVRVYDLGVDEASRRAWFAMDLVLDGEGRPRTLEDARRQGRVTEEQAAGWYDDLRAALDYIHGHGVAHRDVKLENVLIDAAGHAVLSDFGVSRILDPVLRSAAGLASTATFSGTAAVARPVLGTLGYLAPEVRLGGEATPAADLYALGVLLFRLLTGIWYEPATDALALLEPFDCNWNAVLPPLLAVEPDRRAFAAVSPAPKDDAAGRGRGGRIRRVWGLSLALVAIVLALAVVVAGFWPAAEPADTFESLYGVPADFTDEADDGEGEAE